MRDKQIDIAKGIGIILVVLGHCSISTISSFVYLFHMPLFFLISGYLYNENSCAEPLFFFKKKFWGLYVPYVLYEIFFTLARNFLIDVGIYSTSYCYTNHYIDYLDLKELLLTLVKDLFLMGREPLGSTLWFVVVLFFVNIMFLTISIMSKRIAVKFNVDKEIIRMIFIFGAFFIGNLASKCGYTIPRCNNALVMLGIFYIGVILRKKKSTIVYNNAYITISFLILVLNNFYGSISVTGNAYLSPAFLVVNCLAGTYLVFGIAKILIKHNKGKLFERLGQHTFSIMVLHYSAFLIVTRLLLVFFEENKLYEFPIISVDNIWIQTLITIPYLLVGVFLPFGIALLFERLKGNKNK